MCSLKAWTLRVQTRSEIRTHRAQARTQRAGTSGEAKTGVANSEPSFASVGGGRKEKEGAQQVGQVGKLTVGWDQETPLEQVQLEHKEREGRHGRVAIPVGRR